MRSKPPNGTPHMRCVVILLACVVAVAYGVFLGNCVLYEMKRYHRLHIEPLYTRQ